MPHQSEYQRKYNIKSKTGTAEDYQVKVGYRTRRRALEHRHTPLSWDADSDEECTRSGVIPQTKSPNAKKSKGEERTRKDQVVHGNTEIDAAQVVAKAKPLQDVNLESKNTNVAPGLSSSKQNDSSSKIKDKGKRKRIKSRSVRRTHDEKTNPPLLPYGMAYKCDGTDKKRTFNVLAADDVFPSALRAAKRREIEIRRKKERKKIEAQRKITDRVFTFVPKDVDIYLTEYQRNFCKENASQCKK